MIPIVPGLDITSWVLRKTGSFESSLNPSVVTNGQIYVLDMAAKLDDTADYLCTDKWKVSEFPAPFGRLSWPEEEYIKVRAPLTEALSVG